MSPFQSGNNHLYDAFNNQIKKSLNSAVRSDVRHLINASLIKNGLPVTDIYTIDSIQQLPSNTISIDLQRTIFVHHIYMYVRTRRDLSNFTTSCFVLSKCGVE